MFLSSITFVHSMHIIFLFLFLLYGSNYSWIYPEGILFLHYDYILHSPFTIRNSTMAKKNGEKLSSKRFFFVCVPRYTKRKKSFHVCLIQYGIRSIMWVDWNWFSRKNQTGKSLMKFCLFGISCILIQKSPLIHFDIYRKNNKVACSWYEL